MIKKILLTVFFVAGCFLSNAQTEDPPLADKGKVVTETTEEDEQLSIYPNPASSFIVVNNSFKTVIQLSVYNIIGDVVISRSVASGSEDIDISQLASGIYILAYNDGEAVETLRLVKT